MGQPPEAEEELEAVAHLLMLVRGVGQRRDLHGLGAQDSSLIEQSPEPDCLLEVGEAGHVATGPQGADYAQRQEGARPAAAARAGDLEAVRGRLPKQRSRAVVAGDRAGKAVLRRVYAEDGQRRVDLVAVARELLDFAVPALVLSLVAGLLGLEKMVDFKERTSCVRDTETSCVRLAGRRLPPSSAGSLCLDDGAGPMGGVVGQWALRLHPQVGTDARRRAPRAAGQRDPSRCNQNRQPKTTGTSGGLAGRAARPSLVGLVDRLDDVARAERASDLGAVRTGERLSGGQEAGELGVSARLSIEDAH
jgi:hypothetical protein